MMVVVGSISRAKSPKKDLEPKKDKSKLESCQEYKETLKQ